MGREKKKYKKGLKADGCHFSQRAHAKKKEDRLVKPGMFNVFLMDWATGWRGGY